MRSAFKPTVALLLVLAAAGAAAPGGAAASSQDKAKARPARDSARYHEWLEKRVRHELLMLPNYGVFDNLAFQVEGYRVVLLGQVVRPTLRSDAEGAVKRIEGVEQVVNRIEVLPLSTFDDRLRLALFRAIYSQSALQRYAIEPVPPIHVIVRNGHVTLEGVVASEADKNIAYIRANTVPNVFSITNHLRVERYAKT